ncbi:MAG: CDP-alcohol phosphatidyltransferase family protein [Candidatus Bathyarchaeota archaeon]|nr:CDP-alcohol phosphatidyltransferase family protein [Candidatus Bathyarchaeota archaeon]
MGASWFRDTIRRSVSASMQAPFALSFFRIIIAPVFYQLLIQDNWITLPVFVAACGTDILDGYFARKLKRTSDTGVILDAIADFTLISVAYVVFVSKGIYPPWILLLTSSALLQFVFTYKLFKKPDPLGRYIGTMLYFSVFLTIVSPIGVLPQTLFWITSIYICVSILVRWKNNLVK